MQLVKLRLRDFRRFAGDHALDLNEDLIALVGPNEAGKSSLLYAIDLLGRMAKPQATDVTRGQPGPASVSGLYALDDDDRSALESIHGGTQVAHARVTVGSDRERAGWHLDPRPHRDIAPRRRVRDLLIALESDPDLDPQFSASEDLKWSADRLSVVLQLLGSEDESLPADAFPSLDDLARRLRAIRVAGQGDSQGPDARAASSTAEDDRRRARESAAASLVELSGIEQLPTPARRVIDALTRRLPSVAWFGEGDRDLHSDYRVSDIADVPPPALANLCAIASLDLKGVAADLASGRVPHVEKTFERANALLKERFRATWTQSSIYPRLSTPSDGVLRVLIATEGGADYSYPQERSDGLRWFLALHSFVSARGQSQPMLLVDEAERHLHYDAQADLVDALMQQRVVSKVVYTTHSVGCLPPDLGTGIRAILAESDAERSRIANSYWSVAPDGEERVGYTPLLFAMGARLLALTVPRYGVIAEGPSDAILLPSLFREVAGLRSLPYRIVPGLAELDASGLAAIDRHAGRVVCLTDGDDAGEAIRSRLKSAGVASECSVHLGEISDGCTLEDLLSPNVFAEAVNTEIETWGLGAYRVVPTEVPAIGRWRWLEQVASRAGAAVEKLSKMRVAQRAVDIGRRSVAPRLSLVEPTRVESLRSLHASIMEALGVRTAE